MTERNKQQENKIFKKREKKKDDQLRKCPHAVRKQNVLPPINQEMSGLCTLSLSTALKLYLSDQESV